MSDRAQREGLRAFRLDPAMSGLSDEELRVLARLVADAISARDGTGEVRGLSRRARSAMARLGARSFSDLALHTEVDVMCLKGVGEMTLAELRARLHERGLSYLLPF